MASEDAGQQKALLYARVSTDDKGQNPETQMQVMRKWCQDNDVAIVGEYIDEKSGKTLDRSGMQEILSRIQSDEVQFLIARDISRIARDVKDFIDVLYISNAHGCNMRFTSYPDLHPETDAGMKEALMIEWKAYSERNDASIACKQALDRRRSEGKHNSRPMRIVFQEDIDKGLYQSEGLIRTDDKVKHPTIIISQ